MRATVPQVELDISPVNPQGFPLLFEHVLFIDIDGVMHADNCTADESFCFAQNFHDALRAADPRGQLPIVVCSDWRLTSTLAQLRSHFPRDMAHQLIGVTPDMLEVLHANRQTEVQAWMNQHSPHGAWLAIDDRPNWYGLDNPQVFAVPGIFEDGPGGLDEVYARRFAKRLKKFLNPSQSPAP